MSSLSHSARLLALGTTAVLSTATLAACGNSTSGSSSSAKPIIIGTSLSLTGDFSTDGVAFERGYKLWESDVNAHGGINGRKVQLIILNDNSSPTQVDTNYTDLITVKHVDLTFGPFSSLLTLPAAQAVSRYGYAMVEGAGGVSVAGTAVWHCVLGFTSDPGGNRRAVAWWRCRWSPPRHRRRERRPGRGAQG